MIEDGGEDIRRQERSRMVPLVERKEVPTVRHTFLSHTELMIWKNYLVFLRNKRNTILLLLTPVLVCFLLSIMKVTVDYFSSSYVRVDYEISALNYFKKCEVPKDCVSIGYSIITTNTSVKEPEYIASVMQYVADANNLTYGTDVKLITKGSMNDTLNYLQNSPNKTMYQVIFCLDYFLLYKNISFPCAFEHENKEMYFYTIMYNISNSPSNFLLMNYEPYPKDVQLARVKISVDNAFLNYFKTRFTDDVSDDVKERIEIQMQSYPTNEDRHSQGKDVESTCGSFYFYFPSIFCFVVFLLEIVEEKEMKLRKSLIVIGLNNTSFWLSWIITGIVFSFIVSLLLNITGLIFRYSVFLNTPFLINFALHFMFTLSMIFLAFFLSTILNSLKSAYTVTYALILIGIVMQMLLANYLVVYSLYATDLSKLVKAAIYFCYLYPPFNYSKIYDDISVKSSSHYSMTERKWVEGVGYTWKDLFKVIKGKTVLKKRYVVPPTITSFGWLLADIVFFFILTWYWDNVNEKNKGKTSSWLFFLYPSYWMHKFGLPTVKKAIDPDEKRVFSSSEEKDKGLESVEKEKEYVKSQVKNNEPKGVQRILIDGISKTYRLSACCCVKRELNALKPIYFHVPCGELFSLLGHNGAGKSTLLNILTGSISPSSGNARVGEQSLLTGLESAVGICPQYDILWNELTAREHIELYCRLRGYSKEETEKEIRDKLTKVNLTSIENDPVKSYSGGMKRRLSIVLSTIGRQKVIFLDEPTTGLDPANRRYIWKMIKELKSSLAIILTTHSMEEADFLSDRIGIIKKGELKCIGTPLELKKMYGEGYLLGFVCEKNESEYVQKELLRLMPDGRVVSSKGGNIMINIPFEHPDQIKYLTYIMNNNYDRKEIAHLQGKIKECGLNYTTLEEIFLKITSDKEV